MSTKKLAKIIALLPVVGIPTNVFFGCHVLNPLQPQPQPQPEPVNPQKVRIFIDGPDQVALDSTSKFFGSFSDPDFNDKILWSVSDQNVASINQEGEVKGRSVGSCIIYARSERNPAIFSSRLLTVHIIPPKQIKIFGPTSFFCHEKGQFEVKYFPTGCSEGVDWSISPSSAGNIDEKGVLTTREPGNATVTATAKDNPSATYSLDINIKEPLPEELIIHGSPTLPVGITRELTVTYERPDKCAEGVVWSSSRPDTISIDPKTGAVTGVKPGDSIITAKSIYCDVSTTFEIHSDYYHEVKLTQQLGSSFHTEGDVDVLQNHDCRFRLISSTMEQNEIEMPIHKAIKPNEIQIKVGNSLITDKCTLDNNVVTVPAEYVTGDILVNLIGSEIADWISWDDIKQFADDAVTKDDESLVKSKIQVGDYKKVFDGYSGDFVGYAYLVDMYSPNDEYVYLNEDQVQEHKPCPLTFQLDRCTLSSTYATKDKKYDTQYDWVTKEVSSPGTTLTVDAYQMWFKPWYDPLWEPIIHAETQTPYVKIGEEMSKINYEDISPREFCYYHVVDDLTDPRNSNNATYALATNESRIVNLSKPKLSGKWTTNDGKPISIELCSKTEGNGELWTYFDDSKYTDWIRTAADRRKISPYEGDCYYNGYYGGLYRISPWFVNFDLSWDWAEIPAYYDWDATKITLSANSFGVEDPGDVNEPFEHKLALRPFFCF